MKFSDVLFRSWYYFRHAWQTYFSMIFAVTNMITVFYFFVIEHSLTLKNVFTDFILFVIPASITTFIICILLGRIYFKFGPRRSEVELMYETDPYFVRRIVNSQMILNTYLILGKLLSKTTKPELLTKDEKASFTQEIETMKNFLQSRTFSNKLDSTYFKNSDK